MTRINKKKLPSRHTSLGPDKAPHRSFYYAMKLTEKDVAKPFVGVVSTWNEAAPCNIALMRQAQSVKKGVKAASGTPREFCTITVTDGIAMGNPPGTSSFTVEALSLQLEENQVAQDYAMYFGAYYMEMANGSIDSRTHSLAVGDLFGSHNYVIGGTADGFVVG